MRRADFQISNPEALTWIMSHGKIGHLGIIDAEGYPRIVPLNFVWLDGAVYFHGALDGEKFEIFKTNPKVTFSVDIPYSLIPSYWTSKDYACPASIYYKSAHIRGAGTFVEDIAEKAKALQTMMEKDQPEGGYKPITVDEPLYQGPLKKTAIFKIVPLQVDVKVKFGQNLNPTARQNLIAKLEERNEGMDRETAEEIRKTLPLTISRVSPTTKKLVAVCDFLGFSNLVKKTPQETLINLDVNNFKSIFASSIRGYPSQPIAATSDQIFFGAVGYAIFSDTVLIYSLSDDRYGYENVIRAAFTLLRKYLRDPRYRIRIGISYGEFHAEPENHIYVGKALIEAYQLEKAQEWCGAAFTKSAEKIIRESGARGYFTNYPVPKKPPQSQIDNCHNLALSRTEDHMVLNWTEGETGKDCAFKMHGGLPRDYAGLSLSEQKRVEQKLMNTEKFHFDKCKLCRIDRELAIKNNNV